MKILIIGDIHGHMTWLFPFNQLFDEVDKVIFLGDYVDSLDAKPSSQLYVLNSVVNLKKKYPDKITLLIGNHELHYVDGMVRKYSGWQGAMAFSFKDILMPAIKNREIQVLEVVDDVIFSHAGVSKVWVENCAIESLEEINEYLYERPMIFEFTPATYFDQTGNSVTQGPLWIRPDALLKCKLPGYRYVVGHTALNKPLKYRGIHCFDTLHSGWVGLYEDGVFYKLDITNNNKKVRLYEKNIK